MLVLLFKGFKEVCPFDDLMQCDIHSYMSSFMKTGTDIQTVLRVCFRNLRSCNAGNTDGWDLRIKYQAS
jgi:hypothetical protein